MTTSPATWLRWSPRLLGLLTCAFLSLFALDAFDGGPLAETLPAFIVHLAPAAVVLAAVALGWRHEWMGGLAFTALAVAYAVWAREHVSWIATISGPLLVVGILFLTSWTHHRRSPARPLSAR